MNAFSAGIDALFADPNIAIDALYRAGGDGAGVAVRIVWRSPDQVTDFGGGRFVSRARMIEVRIGEIATIEAGDTFEINGETFVVQGDPLRDDLALLWAVELRGAE